MTMIADPWAALDDAVLAVFGDGDSRSTSDVLRKLPDLTHREVRTALQVNVGHGYLTAVRGQVHTTYTITPAGREHLAAAKAV
jgi:hypothetical protein